MHTSHRTLLTTTFSLGMLSSHWCSFDLQFRRMSIDDVYDALEERDWESAVPHLAHAQLLSELLGREIEVCRRSIQMVPGMSLIVAKSQGKALPDWGRVRLDEVSLEFFEIRDWSTHALRLAA